MLLSSNGQYRFGEFELNCAKRTLLRGGRQVPLFPKAFEVLVYLVLNPGRAVTKDELLNGVWPGSFVDESNLAQQISGLRKALGDRADYIVTIPGRGYQFTATVEQEAPEAISGQSGDVVVRRVRQRTHIVMEDLAPAQKALATAAQRLSSRGLAWSVTAAVMLAFAAYFAWQRFGPQPQLRKVEVADFLNLTGDPSIDRTLKSALTLGLSQTPYIQLMSDGLAHSTLQEMQKSPDTPLLGDTALEVCARGHYEALLRGKIEQKQRFGYDLTLEAMNCTTGKSLAIFKGHAQTIDAILDTLDGLARQVRFKLGEPNASLDQYKVPLIDATTFSFEALKDFNIGSELGNAGKLKECIVYFQKAVDIDPKFAMAQASLGTAYYNLGSMDTASEYYKKAFELSGNVSQWEKFYIRSGYYLMAVRDLQASAKNYEEWSKAYPENETTWIGLANAETQLGDFQRAIEAGEHAVKYGPNRPELDYQDLADAYKRANRFGDAKRLIAEAQAQGKDAPELHQLLYRIAMIERDPESLRRESEWNKGKPELYASLESQAVLAADEGRYPEAEELFNSAIAGARREVDNDLADSILMDEAGAEIQLGRTARAAELLHNVQHRDTADFAILQARAGDLAAAEAYLLKPEKYPQDTIEHFLLIPELKALVALRHNDLAAAIAALEPVRPFEMVRCEVMEVRAEAYLAAGQPDKAALEFRKIIANPGLDDIMQPRTVLAHLGLARTLAQQNRVAESQHEYQTFFALWNEGSADLPVLEQAHREYVHLPPMS